MRRPATTPTGGPPRPGRTSSTAATPTRRCVRSRRRSPSSKAPRTRWRSPRGWARSPRSCFALCSSGSHIVAQRQLYAGTLAFLQGPCRRFGIDVTLVDGTVPGRVRRGGAARPHDARARRDAVEPAPRAGRPRRARRAARPVHRRRLDVRHAARPAAAGPRRRTCRCTRPRRASPGTTTPRSASSPASASCSTRSGRTRCCTGRRRRRSTRSTRCAACARWPCAPHQQAATALALAEALAEHPAVAAVHYPGLAIASAVRSGQAADAQRRHGAGDRAGRRPRCRRASFLSTRCGSPAWRRRSAVPRRWCAIRRRRRTPASRQHEAEAMGVTPGPAAHVGRPGGLLRPPRRPHRRAG